MPAQVVQHNNKSLEIWDFVLLGFLGNFGPFFCGDRVMIVLMIKSTFGALEAQSPFWAPNGLFLELCFGCVLSEAIFGSGTWETWADTLVSTEPEESLVLDPPRQCSSGEPVTGVAAVGRVFFGVWLLLLLVWCCWCVHGYS